MAGTWGVGLGKLVPRLNRKVQPSTRYRPGSAPGHAASGASPRPATWQMAHGADASFAAEELKNASLLCERGDLLIKHHERLSEAEGCFKKVSSMQLDAARGSRTRDVCVARVCVCVSVCVNLSIYLSCGCATRPSPSHDGSRMTAARRTCASPATSASRT
jgi:hypothetical protein